MILTNPPFGSKVTSEGILTDLASRDGISKNKGKVLKSLPQEIVFLNRCLELLKPSGKLAIVLPDGVLANSSTQDVRDWILRWARLKAIVSLPQATFSPYGAGVKTSIIFLEKRIDPLPADTQLEIGHNLIDFDEEYEAYMAQIDDVGYDVNGRLSLTEEEAHEPPDIKEAIANFEKLMTW